MTNIYPSRSSYRLKVSTAASECEMRLKVCYGDKLAQIEMGKCVLVCVSSKGANVIVIVCDTIEKYN